MKLDMEIISDLLSSEAGESPTFKTALPTAPSRVIPIKRNAFRATVLYAVGALIAFFGELYLAVQSGAWQLFAVAGIGAILAGLASVSIIVIRRGRPQLGIRWLITASLLSVLTGPLFVAGSGLILGLGVILVVLTIVLQTLPQREANWVLIASVGVALIAGGIDLWGPPWQIILPNFQILISILGGVIILVYGVLTIRQFQTYPLTTKLTLAFLTVSLLPLGLLAFLNVRSTRDVLIEKAEQPLFAAVSKTAADIDTFMIDNLEAIETEAQLPVLATYLNLSAAQRQEGSESTAAATTLLELSRKDKVFIASYALLDQNGHNVLDTHSSFIGRDESERDYFRKPIETGLPYVSPVEFNPTLTESEDQTADDAALYFSSPVHDPVTEMIIGVLRVRYKRIILQKLIVQNNNLVGEESFAILFDENYVRLAHGLAPELIFKSVIPLEARRLTTLQAAGRLPDEPLENLSTNLPQLAEGLDNAIFQTYFTTELLPTPDRVNLVVVKELETQPWTVVFAQPQDLFLTPIESQTRTILFLAIVIAGIVAIAAFGVGQLLANPLVHLTHVVTRFTAGELDARASLKSGDETGLLATSFNRMAEQVGSLLRSLAERTQELEAEINDRERAEADLKVSEAKYRTLFEDSKDAIFITTLEGRIVDINPIGVKLSGYSKKELLRIDLSELYADPSLRSKFMAEIKENGAVDDFEAKFRQKNGAELDCLITATVRQANDGTILGYQGIIRDVTIQKRAEQERLRLSAIEREMTLAQEIQRTLLPPVQPNWERLDIVCYSDPAREIGGDFYAYYAFNSPLEATQPAAAETDWPNIERYAVAVGDVSGKGMPAALLMAVSLASFQSIVGQGLAPGNLLKHLDRALSPYTRTARQNCAIIYTEIDPPTVAASGSTQPGAMRVANAGCMTPLIRRRDGSIEWIEAFGTPLGVELAAEFGYRVIETPLSKGDLIILTTDGVIEANNQAGQMFSFERLEATVQAGPTESARAMLEHLKREVALFVGDTEQHDDVTIVVVRV